MHTNSSVPTSSNRSTNAYGLTAAGTSSGAFGTRKTSSQSITISNGRSNARPARSSWTGTSVVLILVADEVQLARLDLVEHAPVLQCFLTPVRDPDFARRKLADRAGQLVPVGMVGDDQRQLDVRLPRPLADAHPAGGHSRDRIGQPTRPAVVER